MSEKAEQISASVGTLPSGESWRPRGGEEGGAEEEMGECKGLYLQLQGRKAALGGAGLPSSKC